MKVEIRPSLKVLNKLINFLFITATFFGFTADASYNYATTYSEGDVIAFDVMRFSRNLNFDTTTGYRCSRDGYYQFTLHLVSTVSSAAKATINIDDSILVRAHATDDGWEATSSTSVLVQCLVGQTVAVVCAMPSCDVRGTTRFTGRLVKGK